MSTYEFQPPSASSIEQLTKVADSHFYDDLTGAVCQEKVRIIGDYFVDIRTSYAGLVEDDTVRGLSYRESPQAQETSNSDDFMKQSEKDYGSLDLRIAEDSSNTDITISFRADGTVTYDIFRASDTEVEEITEENVGLFSTNVCFDELDQMADSVERDELGLNILNEQQAKICKELLMFLPSIDTPRPNTEAELKTHFETLLNSLTNEVPTGNLDMAAARQPVSESTVEECKRLALGSTNASFMQEVHTKLQNGNELDVFRTRPLVVISLGKFALKPPTEYAISTRETITNRHDEDIVMTIIKNAEVDLRNGRAIYESGTRVDETILLFKQHDLAGKAFEIEEQFNTGAVSYETMVDSRKELAEQQTQVDKQMLAAKNANKASRQLRERLRADGHNKMSDVDAKHLTGLLLSDEL